MQATSLVTNRWRRWREKCNAGIFVMECVTPEEARALR